MNDEPEFFCSCHVESVRLWRNEDGDVEFAIWKYGQGSATWRERCRWIWRIIRRGTPYGDQIVLSSDQAQQLGRSLCGHSTYAFPSGTTWTTWTGL